jgi:ElaB/YqjD/DUF883 family membrane-anchored ribosome-binding protein
MEIETNNNFVKHGHAVTDKAADKIQSAIRDAQKTTSAAGATLSKVTGQAQGIAKQGIDVVANVAQQTCDTASQASDTIVSYTKDNPIKALMIAAASGALLLTFIRLLTPSRD